MDNRRLVVIDTSVFIESLEEVINLNRDYRVLFPIVVADELNNLKESRNPETAYRARQAINYIRHNSKGWQSKTMLDPNYDNDKNIYNTALIHGALLATFDYGMELRAKMAGIEIVPLSNDCKAYTGYKVVELDSTDSSHMEKLARFFSNSEYNHFGNEVNEYVIIKQDGLTIRRCCWTGKEYRKLFTCDDLVKPQNDYQALAIDLLLNDDIPVKVIYGTAGSGKSFLSTKLAVSMLRDVDRTYRKIMLVRNPIGSGERIGFLKGDKYDKIIDFFKPFQQHLDDKEFGLERLMQSGQLELEIPYYMKGLDIQNTLVIFDEAEDSDKEIMRLVGGRISEGSSIVILGDKMQSEGKFSNGSNGLNCLVRRAKGNESFGCVYLPDDLRGEASKLFVEIF